MPFQPINFANIQPQGSNFIPDLVQRFMQGYQAGQMPAQMRRKSEEQDIADSLRKAQIEKLNQQSNLPFGGEIAPGAIGQAMWLNMIKGKYGENSPEFQDARRSYEAELSKNQALIDYRNLLGQSSDKRFASPLGREELEIADIEAGFQPGSRRMQELNPEQQQEMLERYKLKRQKGISDVQSRQRALFASNVDKTLEEINPKDLTQYGGSKGQIALSGDKFSSAFGKAPERFVKYQKALTLANLLAKQVRQFYGDSITPQIQEKLGELTNPASWTNNPQVALEKYNTFKNILEKETSTYRGALKSTKEFEGKSESSKPKKLKFNPLTGGFE